MNRLFGLLLIGLLMAQPASADEYSWKDKRQAECTQRANDRNMVNRQEFVDFCLNHNDAEVQRYWNCAPRADQRELGEDTRRSFVDWCVKQGKSYTPKDANRFAECNAQATQQNLQGAYHERYVSRCVAGELTASADEHSNASWKDKRQAECTQRANDRNMVNRQEFVDFCLNHNDAEVQRYWNCAPRADQRELGEDTRQSFIDWCIKQGKNYTPKDANRFAECNAQAARQNIQGAYRDRYVSECVAGKLK